MNDLAALKLLVLAHAAATLILVGVIWVIQLVHYPLFRFVGDAAYPAYQSAHVGAITLVVLPVMLVELLTGFALLAAPLPGLPGWVVWAGISLIALIWIVTGLVNAPQHGLLAAGFDADVHRALVLSNWVRTAAWSVRGGLALWMLAALMR